ncbi:MAG: Tn3 family transposase [Nocardioidaceae bacterium]
MPVDFLTEDQQRRYGRYAGEPTPAQLERYFHLDDKDRGLIGRCRTVHTRLGFAVQLATVRFLGTFLANPAEVPPGVVAYIARQLGITETEGLSRYAAGEKRWDHAAAIRRHYGYRDFHEGTEAVALTHWLANRAWISAERPSVLFDLATARLVERKVLLPGVTVLARLVAQVRDQAATRLWHTLARTLKPQQAARLETLLIADERSRQSPLERLRRAPTRVSVAGLVGALERLEEIRALGVGPIDLSRVPPVRVQTLARYAVAARAQAIARMPPPRRHATLLAFVQMEEITALDDVLDLLDQLITAMLARVEHAGQQRRLRTLKDLDRAALLLRQACLIVLDHNCADGRVRDSVFDRVPRDQLAQAAAQVAELVGSPDDHSYEDLRSRYSQVRQFLPGLLRAIEFTPTVASRPVVEAIRFLKTIEGQKRPDMSQAPRALLTPAWERLVIGPEDRVDRRLYTFCTLERLQDGLRHRDLFVSSSRRWGDPHARLLHGPAWEKVRMRVCRTLGRSPTPTEELEHLGQQLSDAYRRAAANLPGNIAVTIDCDGRRDVVTLTPLDKLDEPDSLIDLRRDVTVRLPRVDLTEILLEVQAWTGFASEFRHISEGDARVADLDLSLCAVLLAEACNIGLEPLVRPDVPALTRGRLSWVQQNYLRAETITRANARLVDYQAQIPLSRAWGGGEVASADGLRFVVPVRTLNAGPNSKYFNADRGVTYYNFTSNQFTGIHGIVVPGTIRDSLFILEGLLEQQTSLRPQEVMSDTAGYSDLVFGLFWLLGYQFSPRLADFGESRFWRMVPKPDYGPLNGLARQRINIPRIARNWDDMLRVAGSLKMGMVGATELVRGLQGGGRPSTLGKAIGELGRVAKTLYLLNYLDDEAYRRRILTQLNRGESRHGVARAIFHGQRGELRQRYREGQEDQLGALGLVVNAVVLWNTRYLDAALAQVRASGRLVKLEDEERLSPLLLNHINVLGRYEFLLKESIRQGRLRPLRNPDELDDRAA